MGKSDCYEGSLHQRAWREMFSDVDKSGGHVSIRDVNLQNGFFLSEQVEANHLSESTFQRVNFYDCTFVGGHWTDVVFENNEFSQVVFRFVFFDRVRFVQTYFHQVRFEHCVFKECEGVLESALPQAVFVGCRPFQRDVSKSEPTDVSQAKAAAVVASDDRFGGLEREING